MKTSTKILKGFGITALILVLGILLFKVYVLENQEPHTRTEVYYIPSKYNYSDEDLWEKINLLESLIMQLTGDIEYLNITNITIINQETTIIQEIITQEQEEAVVNESTDSGLLQTS